ncbi:Tn7-like transposition protein D [Thermoanaerobacterium thermosaccharolyticum]|uniref:Tn7-like transposition protein D n=1 Tax=Thermoanaerobacterium thermosaccharolyticum TaxID=1517 RepID=A0A223I015_THETR|nr:Tn7-like transposition protein D [Thermoanaerobacterium thermosaccharolyticum]
MSGSGIEKSGRNYKVVESVKKSGIRKEFCQDMKNYIMKLLII